MTFHFRPAKREKTPLIIGLAGPTKSGKTYSAHRLARGLAAGGTVAMINAEGAKGHQYAEKFDYVAADITAPFRPERYTEVLKTALALDPRPAVVIIDSLSHMHDGPGGMLEYHEAELDRLAGKDIKARQRSTWSAWVKPKAAENEFIYTMLGADCHVIACFRAKPKLKIIRGQEPVELGLQPIASERVAFETIFSLMLPAHSKGVPDLDASEMREPFDRMIPRGEQLSEEVGVALAEWAAGGAVSERGNGLNSDGAAQPSSSSAPRSETASAEEFRELAHPADEQPKASPADRKRITQTAQKHGLTKEAAQAILIQELGVDTTAQVPAAKVDHIIAALARESGGC